MRTNKTVNGKKTEFVWNGQNLAAETTGDSINVYTYDPRGIYIDNREGEVRSYIQDYHNNVWFHRNADGSAIEKAGERLDYDAYGNQLAGAEPDPFGYCGEYMDSETGLIYLRNRYYDTTTGRFITEDPAKDGVNWYSYCDNNPVIRTDMTGLSYDEVIDALDNIYNAKNTMLREGRETYRYNTAYKKAMTAKNTIEKSDVYMEDWGSLTNTLKPIINGDNNSLTKIKDVKDAVVKAKDKANAQDVKDDIIYMIVVGGATTLAIKASSALLAGGSTIRYPGNDPSKSPGNGWEWRGNGNPGTGEGNWYNPNTGESLHPDLDHPNPIGPHWDYKPSKDGPWYRIYPDGNINLK